MVHVEIRLRAATCDSNFLFKYVIAVTGTGCRLSSEGCRASWRFPEIVSFRSLLAGVRGDSVPPAGAGAEPQHCLNFARKAARPKRAHLSHSPHGRVLLRDKFGDGGGLSGGPLRGEAVVIWLSMRGFVNREFSPRAKNLFLDALSPRFYPHSIQA